MNPRNILERSQLSFTGPECRLSNCFQVISVSISFDYRKFLEGEGLPLYLRNSSSMAFWNASCGSPLMVAGSLVPNLNLNLSTFKLLLLLLLLLLLQALQKSTVVVNYVSHCVAKHYTTVNQSV